MHAWIAGEGAPGMGSPHLAECGLLVAEPHDEDAVCLAQAAHGPGCQRRVRLVEHNAVGVFLLSQPP